MSSPSFDPIAEMVFRVAQFGDFEGDLFLLFFGLFFDRGELFSQLFIEEDPLDDFLARLGIFIEKVLDSVFHFLDDRRRGSRYWTICSLSAIRRRDLSP